MLSIDPDYIMPFSELASMLSKSKLFQDYVHFAIPTTGLYNQQAAYPINGSSSSPHIESNLNLYRRLKGALTLPYTWKYTFHSMNNEYDAEQLIKQRFERPVLKFCPHTISTDLETVPVGQLSSYRHSCSKCRLVFA